MKQHFRLTGSFQSVCLLAEWLVKHNVPFIEMWDNCYLGSRQTLAWLEKCVPGFHTATVFDMDIIVCDTDMMLLAQIAFSDRIEFRT